MRRELATAHSIVAELDDVLWERPDASSVACRGLAGLRAQLNAAPDERAQWWFGKAVACAFQLQQLYGGRPPAPTVAYSITCWPRPKVQCWQIKRA